MSPKIQKQPTSIDEAINGVDNRAMVVPTIKQLIKVWAEYRQANSGFEFKDNNAEEMAKVAIRLVDCYNQAPWTENDFVLLCGYLNEDRDTLVTYFKSLVEFLIRAKRVTEIKAKDSVYSHDSYFFI